MTLCRKILISLRRTIAIFLPAGGRISDTDLGKAFGPRPDKGPSGIHRSLKQAVGRSADSPR
jgi:hypothetical protein